MTVFRPDDKNVKGSMHMNAAYEHKPAMLEVYSPGDMQSPDYECGIWVPICRVPDKGEQEMAETVASATLPGILYK